MMLGLSILLIHSMLLTERQRLEILENEILDQQADWKAQWEQAQAAQKAVQDSQASYLHDELEKFEKEVESELGIVDGAPPAPVAAAQVQAQLAPAFVPEPAAQVIAQAPETLAPMVDDYAAAAAPAYVPAEAAPAFEAAPAPSFEAAPAPAFEAAPAPAFEAALAPAYVPEAAPAQAFVPEAPAPAYAPDAAPAAPAYAPAAPAFGAVPAPQAALPYGAVLPVGAVGIGVDGQERIFIAL